jgi:hypothetical protein
MIVTVAATASCSGDIPSSPSGGPPAGAPSNGGTRLLAPIAVVPLHRTVPLATAQSASARIGVLGGSIALPAAGLTVVVPPLSVVTNVTITVTALAGSDVAYEFSPHGLSFLVPLVATQDLENTDARSGGPINPLALYVGYFPDSSHLTTVTELLDLRIDLLGQTSTALLSHFSGYVWASGREGDSIDGAAAAVRRHVDGPMTSGNASIR